MEIIYKKATELIPYANNTRTHSEEQVQQIASSIKEFGFTNWRFCDENKNYVATDCGNILRVRRFQKNKDGSERIEYKTVLLKGSVDRYGYKTVKIKGKHKKAHRLILSAFIKNAENKKEVNHIDGDKQNNNLYNLEWATREQNNRHAILTGLLKFKKGDSNKNTKIKQFDYITIYLLCEYLGYRRIDIAKKNNVSRQTIDKIIKKVKSIIPKELHVK